MPMPYQQSTLTTRWLLVPGVIAGLLLFGVGLAILAAGSGSMGERAGAAAGLLIGGSVLAGALLVFARVRVEVSRDGLAVRLGPAGVSLASGEIASIEVERYAWWRYGGWGLRRRLGGGARAYTVAFRTGGVCIAATDGRQFYVSSDAPHDLRAAVLRVMERKRGVA